MQRRCKSGKSSVNNKKVHMLDMDLKDILREHALRYLPAKALFRSLTVCRDWKLLISTPFFVHNQSFSCRSFSGVFAQTPGNPPSFISLDQMAYGVPDQELKFLPEPVDIKASTNGLLCCVGRGVNKAYYVCNPVNQQWKKLPKPSTDHGSDPAIALVFEPSVLSFIADFKVVCVFASIDIEGAYEFEIYSSDRDSWKVSSEMYFANSCILYGDRNTERSIHFGRGMYFDGIVYWSMGGKTLSFDMKTQKVSGMFYGVYASSSLESCLGTMDGKLCTSSILNQSINVTLIYGKHANTMSVPADIAKLRKTHVSRINYGNVSVGYDRPQVLAIWDGVAVFCVGSKVFSHDMKTHETRALLQGDMNVHQHAVVLPYVNSLVALV